MCAEDPEQFICVLIDEVESIAASRESSMYGEVQDSLRATNALLTGLDRAKIHSNIIFLCTSNMYNSLDVVCTTNWRANSVVIPVSKSICLYKNFQAFLDRCGLKLAIEPPPPAIQYEILRGRLNSLIIDKAIKSQNIIPGYRDAKLEYISPSRLCAMLRNANFREGTPPTI
jgi:SpoVK/Ycf46/Vps4 family AAA+-type ATPase